MATSVNAGARLDRLPISSFHKRIFFLIGAGMFFDGYDLYVGTNVLGAVVQSKFATLEQVPQFISLTFLGLTIGSFVTGFIGDRYGRRFTYQFNLMIFGLASLAAAFAPDMMTLNILRFVMGLGLGAEIVVGYSTMTEFVPPRTRGRWLAFMSFIVVFGLPATALLGYLIIPNYGWRPMFVICGLGSLVVWYLRKSLPESPRWLETQGRTAEAEALMQAIEKEAATAAPLPPPQPATPIPPFSLSSLLTPSLLPSMVVGSVALIMINTLIFGFVQWLPTLRSARFEHHQIVRLHARDHHGVADRLRHRRVQLRLLRSQALTHCSGPSYDRTGSDLSVHARGKRPAHGWLPADRRDLRPGRDPVRSLHAGAVPD
jgi:putative MFS transporter